ncbi:hypothetical protein A9A89_0944 [Bifidobacterium psychraerophilum DSM 22366]|uniref:Cation/multidrug efflux pump n=2 Tax=Bifidobacterium psychraerophilum TaxID=218140 RepID=A0A087CI71_9BIFI|nr:cation/multidrug efflux pump [Bifidobacterium psychraerophilum]PKA94719.1 hypothetical protein A9A89_0944 [Bifidobacterium psychraerophilum DSM 22366]
MDSPPQLAQQILFSLDRLGDTNGHHEYEQICFAFARRRISINLLPATGPVSAGGDQGRDSETFWSNLGEEIPRTSVYASTVSTERVVLACTIQKSGVPAKIRSDLASIAGKGTPVARVLYFTVASVPVAKRHELISAAKTDHDIDLEIFDGPALAEHLSDPDLFWIAAQYLRLPSSLAPERTDNEESLPDWYIRDRDYWRARTDPGRTMGDLISLRDILRHSTFNDQGRADLGDWIAKMREFLTVDGAWDVQMRARYEISVATLRGTGTLRPADLLFREFFKSATEIEDDLPLLEDAVVLLQYGYGARLRGKTDIAMTELDHYYDALRAHIRMLLGSKPYPNARALLLAIDTRLAFFPAYPKNLPGRIEGLIDPRDSLRMVLDAYDAGETVQARGEAIPLRDLDGGFASLNALLDALPSAPVFPVEATAEMFDLLALSLASHPKYEQARDRLDEAVARVGGDAQRAERARARAITFAKAGQLLRALGEVHNAKIGWWHGETVEDSIPMMLLAASIYERLGLFFAAKLQAFAAAVAATSAYQPSTHRFVPQAIAVAAVNDFKAGNWCSASQLFRITLLAQNALAEDPGNFDRHEYLVELLRREAFALHVAKKLAPMYEPAMRLSARNMGTEALLDTLGDQISGDEEWTVEGLVTKLDEQGVGRPFADAGPTRDVRWSAFGTVWTVRSQNTRRSTLAAERLISAMQIIQAELASSDAVWIPTEVRIEVRSDGDHRISDEGRLERVPDRKGSHWIVHLALSNRMQEEHALTELVTDASLLLLDASLLNRDQFLELVKDAFATGLWHKLFAGRPYNEAADFLSDEDYDIMSSLPPGPLGAKVPRKAFSEQPELNPRTDIADRYNHDEAIENIKRRYARMMPIGRLTIPRLASNGDSAEVLRKLRDEGWLDWQLVMAITNIIGNARHAWEGLHLTVGSPLADRKRANELLRREELKTDPKLGPETFTRERLLGALEFTVALTVPSYGLALNSPTPDIAAILKVLRERFKFGDDDADHNDLLFIPRD